METTDYVSYELAVKLKAAGFDEPCDHIYMRDRKSDTWEFADWTVEERNYNKRKRPILAISAPTLWQAQKWLRKKWGIHVDACVFSDYSTDADGNVCDRWDFWGFDLYAVVGGYRMIDDDGEYDSYEQALSAGISAALELIKKGE